MGFINIKWVILCLKINILFSLYMLLKQHLTGVIRVINFKLLRNEKTNLIKNIFLKLA